MEIKELLEKAAKALLPQSSYENKAFMSCWFSSWNPATDDGDCARMEAELGINISWWTGEVTADACEYTDAFCNQYYKDFGGDKQAARRMASLLVAAAIYDSMG